MRFPAKPSPAIVIKPPKRVATNDVFSPVSGNACFLVAVETDDISGLAGAADDAGVCLCIIGAGTALGAGVVDVGVFLSASVRGSTTLIVTGTSSIEPSG